MSKFLPNSTQIANSIIDEVMPKLSDAALRCYLIIVRQTTGWHKEQDSISISQFMDKTGKSKNTVIKGCDELEKLELITKIKTDKSTSKYSLNLFNICTSSKSELVQNLNRGSSKSEQDLVQNLNRGSSKSEHTENNSLKTKKTTNTKTSAKNLDLPDDINPKAWAEFLANRSRLKAKNTDYAINLVLTSLDKVRDAGYDVTEAINKAIERNWKSVDVEWLANAGLKTKTISTQKTGLPNWMKGDAIEGEFNHE